MSMNERYEPQSIEARWQKRWEDARTFAADRRTGAEKRYVPVLATTAASLEGSRTLAAVSNGPGTAADKVGQLFLVVLSRQPTGAESKRLVAYVESGGPANDPKAALADVFWALLNSTEFAVNH